MEEPLDCLALGASQSIKELADDGIAYPIRELPAASPDRSLILMPALIARINLEATMPAPFYASFDDAIAQNNPSRYLDLADTIYRLHQAITAVNLTCGRSRVTGSGSPIAYSISRVVSQGNRHDFGWLVGQTTGYSAPGFSASSTKHIYLEEVIQIYKTVEAEVSHGTWSAR